MGFWARPLILSAPGQHVLWPQLQKKKKSEICKTKRISLNHNAHVTNKGVLLQWKADWYGIRRKQNSSVKLIKCCAVTSLHSVRENLSLWIMLALMCSKCEVFQTLHTEKFQERAVFFNRLCHWSFTPFPIRCCCSMWWQGKITALAVNSTIWLVFQTFYQELQSSWCLLLWRFQTI